MTDVTTLPQSINLDLDAAERPAEEIKGPFRFNVKDRTVTMSDPADLDWRDLILLDSPTEFIRLALQPEDRQFLLEQPLPGWKFNLLMEGYYKHYDLEEKLREARRNQRLQSV